MTCVYTYMQHIRFILCSIGKDLMKMNDLHVPRDIKSLSNTSLLYICIHFRTSEPLSFMSLCWTINLLVHTTTTTSNYNTDPWSVCIVGGIKDEPTLDLDHMVLSIYNICIYTVQSHELGGITFNAFTIYYLCSLNKCTLVFYSNMYRDRQTNQMFRYIVDRIKKICMDHIYERVTT